MISAADYCVQDLALQSANSSRKRVLLQTSANLVVLLIFTLSITTRLADLTSLQNISVD